MIGDGVHALLRRALGTEDPTLVSQVREHFAPAYDRHVVRQTRLYEGLQPVLTKLGDDGLVLAVATNKPARWTRQIIEALDLSRYLAAHASSDEVPHRKPDPAVLRLALERAHADPTTTVYVGDLPVDVATARAHGCPVIGAGWGFSRRALADAQPDVLIDDPADLPSVLERLVAQAD